MPLIDTSQLTPLGLDPQANLQTYCGLDCCVTLEVLEELRRQHNELPQIYSFERALQGPYLEMMQRGIQVDVQGRAEAASELRQRIQGLQGLLNELATAIWDKPLNPRSPKQIQEFFYQRLRLPEVWISQKGQRKLSTNREALEKLEEFLYARPFAATILAIRDLAKQLEVFETEIDSDGCFRTSYNIAGTETGRPSSSSNAFGTGGNLQNISPGLRWPFQSRPGMKLCQIDLEQVEMRDVGYFMGCLFDDWSLLDACESGDAHTYNSRLIWPEVAWTGELARDRELAEQLYYRQFSRRDMSKRGGHLTDYMGTAWTTARILKIELSVAEQFRERYLEAYPGLPRYWRWVAEQLQTTHRLTTPFGRQRQFFGRPNDDTTLREAIAFLPQSTTADRTNLVLWRIWKLEPEIRLLGQTYDSVLFEFPEGRDDLVEAALRHFQVVLWGPGRPGTSARRYMVPAEAKVGWNWGYRCEPKDLERARAAGKPLPRLNPDGLGKFPDDRKSRSQRRPGRISGQ